ncbi:helix-turn-helix domain-containing protein [Bacillus cereus]|uniref:helix-turn-helix domain-containing protein n=1 Tax=Bacillus cereus TaxID=1396 RepID=UPI0027DC5944|nr:helix-turn-helix domain-containing protein [Bacillus thuringiensis]MEB9334505.1 helix-turn-helix domain-containing protein [Bacillus cereus]
MEGYTMVDVAAILGMHRQSVASYVKKFKEHALEGLLTRKQIPGKKTVFNASTTGRIEATYFTYNSSGVAIRSRIFLEYTQYPIHHQKEICDLYVA